MGTQVQEEKRRQRRMGRGVRWRRKYTPKEWQVERQVGGKMKIQGGSEEMDKTEEDGLTDTHRREGADPGRAGEMGA